MNVHRNMSSFIQKWSDTNRISFYTIILKWLLIIITITVNNTLAWKIWRRKNIHTIFNLSMCFYFFFVGSIFPLLINDYGNLLEQTLTEPDATHPDICHRILLYRVFIIQGTKVFILNILFR